MGGGDLSTPFIRPSGAVSLKGARDKATRFLWLSQAGHSLTKLGSHLLHTLLQHWECNLLHPLEWLSSLTHVVALRTAVFFLGVEGGK